MKYIKTFVSRAFRLLFPALAGLWLVVVQGATAQLTGTKTIGGTAPNYPTIKAALNDLMTQGTAMPGVTFLIRSGTYDEVDSLVVQTATASASAPVVIKPDAGATVVVNVTPSSTTLPSVIKIDGTPYVTIDGSNNGTTSRDLTLNSLGTNGLRGVLVYGTSDYATVRNCVVRVPSANFSARTISWEYAGAGLNPNNGLIENNRVVSGFNGIRCEGSQPINNITIRNNIVDSASYYGIYVSSTNFPLVYGNEIMHVGGSSGANFIYMAGATRYGRIYNNKIHDASSTSTGSSIVGIYENGSSTLAQHSFFNNFIWNLNPPNTGTGAVYGFFFFSANTTIPDTFAFNSVNLTGSSTGERNSSAFYKASGSSPIYLYNNILLNTRTDGLSGVAAAITKQTSAAVLTSNNNDLYVGTPDAQHAIGRIGTTSYSTLNDWRTASGGDAASFLEDAPFVSATDLHIRTTVPTQLESGAIPIAGMAFDIDNQLRNAATPDVGADEGTFIHGDFSPPLITYTPLKNTGVTTGRTLMVSVFDPSGVPRSGVGLPVLYWRRNAGSYTGVQGTYVSGTQYSFTFGAGVVAGDSVGYYIAAQDSVTPPNVGVLPSTGAYGFTPNPPAAANPPVNPSNYLIVQPALAAGDYSVGLTLFQKLIGKELTAKTFSHQVIQEVPSGITPDNKTGIRKIEEQEVVLMDGSLPYAGPTRILLTDELRARFGIAAEVMGVYPTITAAMNDLSTRGVRGSVRFLLVDAAYPAETFPITVNVTTDSVPAANKTVTIKPSTGVSAVMVGASATGPLFQIFNTNYVTIDGSNTVGGTTRNLTIRDTSTIAIRPYSAVIWFGSQGSTPITNCALKNTVVIGVSNSTTVVISGIQANLSPGYFDNMTIQNNDFRGAYEGVYATGGTIPQHGSNLFYLQNIANDATMKAIGLYMQGVNGAVVQQNDMGNFDPADPRDDTGIWLDAGTINAVVERNNIHDLGSTDAFSGHGGHGIYVGSGVASANIAVRNNMISHMYANGNDYTLDPTHNPGGIMLSGSQTGISVHYNTINLYGNTINNANALPMGICLNAGSVADVRNNLIVNRLGGAGYGAVGIFAATANTQFSAIDYNNYYVRADSPFVNIIGKIGTSDYTTLSAWAAASGGETHSLNTNVNFLSPANLHMNTFLPSTVDSAGTPIAGITTDFDGDTRNAARPDIGADEFTRSTGSPIGILSITRNVRVPNAGDSLVVSARIIDSTGAGITADSLLYSVNGVLRPPLPFVRTSGSNTDGNYRGVIPGSANTGGARIEYQIFTRNASYANTTAIVGANSYFAGITPISPTGLRAQDSLYATPYKGYYVRVAGTVNGPNWQSANLSTYIQDALGGLNLFKSGATSAIRNPGDSLTVLGKIDQYRGVTEIVPDSLSDIVTVATGRTVSPISLTVTQYNANPELYESRLLKFTSINRKYTTPPWPPAITAATIIMQQNGPIDTLTMYINAGTNIPGSTEPTYPVHMVCIGTQFAASGSATQGGYEVLPRSVADFTSALPPPGWTAQTSGTSTMLNSVKAIDVNTGWIGGDGVRMLRTLDGGLTWTNVAAAPITGDIYAIDALDADHALATTSPGGGGSGTFLYRTTNGGTGWTQVFSDPGTSAFLDAIKMFDANNGIVIGDPVGGRWTILRTTNGGTSWVRDTVNAPLQAGTEGGSSNGMATAGTTNIWFLSNNSPTRVYRTTNGGTTWTSSNLPFTATFTSGIAFADARYGVVGANAGQAARTVDGGATWTSTTLPGGTAAIYGIAVVGVDFFATQGTNVYRSTDRGVTWTTSYTGAIGAFNHVSFSQAGANTRGWAVTSTGGIAAGYFTLTDVKNAKDRGIPASFALDQNYPNPFNPTTTIQFALPKQANVTLKIYNVLGQEVATLVNDTKQAGYHQMVWNGRNQFGNQVATGVYFYRLEARSTERGDPFVSIKKMLMLK